MSGHSKWHQIKHKKAQTDGQKSQMFGRLARDILLAARAGNDPAVNASLREVIARAKKANMPQQNIDRLLADTAADTRTSIVYEGFGPHGVALLITALTDNPNRTVAEMRTLLKKHGGELGGAGSVRWKFATSAELTASLTNNNTETLVEALIDASAQDLTVHGKELQITAAPPTVPRLQEILAAHRATVRNSRIVERVVPPHQRTVTAEAQAEITALCAELTAHPDVHTVTTDLAP